MFACFALGVLNKDAREFTNDTNFESLLNKKTDSSNQTTSGSNGRIDRHQPIPFSTAQLHGVKNLVKVHDSHHSHDVKHQTSLNTSKGQVNTSHMDEFSNVLNAKDPTRFPTPVPTKFPTAQPTKFPTPVPSKFPTPVPSKFPTPVPTKFPTPDPTQSPTSKAPSRTPTTHGPTTRGPTTRNPTTCGPTTAAPSRIPTTNNPTSCSPTTFAPTSRNPTTFGPSTCNPTTDVPSTSPSSQNPTTRGPTSKSPTTQGPTTCGPTSKGPTTYSPTSRNPTTLNPTSRNPTSRSPTTSSPTTGNPTTLHPTCNPTSSQPTMDPTSQNPTSRAPTYNPTSKNPTTQPTTDAPTTCSAKYWPEFGQCNLCTNGYYCPDGYQKVPCPNGADTNHTLGSTNWTTCVCSPGYYGTVINASVSNCTQCSAGEYCTGGLHRTQCPLGYWCDPASNKTLCTTGMYCPEGTGYARNCTEGYYCKTTTTIQKCQEPIQFGYYCGPGTVQEIPCAKDHYCPNTTVQIPCPDGVSCPVGTYSIADCDAGLWCNATTGVSTNCIDGEFCPRGTYKQTNRPLCALGSYCPNTITQIECSQGKYCPEGATAQSDCEAGYQCPTPAQKNQCPNATYCPAGTVNAAPCPAGFYCAFPNTSSVCSNGFYCPENSTSLAKCPAGSFCPTSAEKFTCISPAYCPVGSITNTTCEAGFYCPNTTTQLTCSSGDICEAGSIAPLDCPSGFYCPLPSQRLNCSAGSGGVFVSGRFCPARTVSLSDCPAGFYCSNASAEAIACSTERGEYCPASSTKASQCPLGSYCPSTQYFVECTVGHYCEAGSNSSSDCPAGFYCPNASHIVACDTGIGAYCPAGSSSQGECENGYFCSSPDNRTLCTLGMYCPKNSTSGSLCDAGYYCPSTSTRFNCTKQGLHCPLGSSIVQACEAGYYCPTPASRIPCNVGQYCPEGSIAPTACSQGKYCPNSTGLWGRVSVACVSGYYCPENSTDLIACQEGNFCADPKVLSECAAGEYCPSGSVTASKCEAGSYCPNTTVQMACPAGTLSSQGATNCTTCPENKYCPSEKTIIAESCPTNALAPVGSSAVTDCSCDVASGYQGTIDSTGSVCTEIPNDVDLTVAGILAALVLLLLVLAIFAIRSESGQRCFQYLLLRRVQIAVGSAAELLDISTDFLLYHLVISTSPDLSRFRVAVLVILCFSALALIYSYSVHFPQLCCGEDLTMSAERSENVLFDIVGEHGHKHYGYLKESNRAFHRRNSRAWKAVSEVLLSPDWVDKEPKDRGLEDTQAKSACRIIWDLRRAQQRHKQIKADLYLCAVEDLPMLIIGLSYFSYATCSDLRSVIFRLSMAVTGVLFGTKAFKFVALWDLRTLMKKQKDQVYHLALDVHGVRMATHYAARKARDEKLEEKRHHAENEDKYHTLLQTSSTKAEFLEQFERIWGYLHHSRLKNSAMEGDTKSLRATRPKQGRESINGRHMGSARDTISGLSLSLPSYDRVSHSTIHSRNRNPRTSAAGAELINDHARSSTSQSTHSGRSDEKRVSGTASTGPLAAARPDRVRPSPFVAPAARTRRPVSRDHLRVGPGLGSRSRSHSPTGSVRSHGSIGGAADRASLGADSKNQRRITVLGPHAIPIARSSQQPLHSSAQLTAFSSSSSTSTGGSSSSTTTSSGEDGKRSRKRAVTPTLLVRRPQRLTSGRVTPSTAQSVSPARTARTTRSARTSVRGFGAAHGPSQNSLRPAHASASAISASRLHPITDLKLRSDMTGGADERPI